MASWLAPTATAPSAAVMQVRQGLRATIALRPVVRELVAHFLGSPPVQLLEHLGRAPVAHLAVRLEEGAVGDFLGEDVTKRQRGDGAAVILAVEKSAALDQRQVVLERTRAAPGRASGRAGSSLPSAAASPSSSRADAGSRSTREAISALMVAGTSRSVSSRRS